MAAWQDWLWLQGSSGGFDLYCLKLIIKRIEVNGQLSSLGGSKSLSLLLPTLFLGHGSFLPTDGLGGHVEGLPKGGLEGGLLKRRHGLDDALALQRMGLDELEGDLDGEDVLGLGGVFGQEEGHEHGQDDGEQGGGVGRVALDDEEQRQAFGEEGVQVGGHDAGGPRREGCQEDDHGRGDEGDEDGGGRMLGGDEGAKPLED